MKRNSKHQLLQMRERSLGYQQRRASKRIRRRLEREGIVKDGLFKREISNG